MKIALLVQTYLPDRMGGTETYVHQLAEGLAKRGHEVAVVYHGRPKGKLGPQVYGVVTLDPFTVPKRVHGFRRGRDVDPPGFEKFLLDWKPDLAHFHSFNVEAGMDHVRVLRRHGIRYFLTYHLPAMSCLRGTLLRFGSEVCDGKIELGRCGACKLEADYFPRPLAEVVAKVSVPWWTLPEGPWQTRLAMPSLAGELAKSFREFLAGAAHVVACAEWTTELLRLNGLPHDKLTVIRQALPGKDRDRKLTLPPKEKPIRLGYFGRLAEEKGIDLLLQAMKAMSPKGVTCEIVGPVNERDSGIRFENIPGVTFRGPLRDEALREWIRSIDLMVLPSRWLETGPLALLETWDQGVPAIGTDLGGIREFFHANKMESLLFKPEDPAAIVTAVDRALAWSAPAPSAQIAGMESLVTKMEAIYQR